ncbi:MAG: YraN family protein [Anaerolineales bacterium]|jgi:putative endonuclease
MSKVEKIKKKALGDWGETYAEKYLEGKGYQILDRNIRTPYGEIDIIGKKDEQLVFVEVKTRTSKKFGYPEEAITEKKVIHLIESAEFYLQENTDMNIDWRIDAIAIQVDPQRSSPKLTHFKNAIT